MKATVLTFCFIFSLITIAFAGESTIELFPFKANLTDKASLQRGAKAYMNYCSGCHSLQYMRYQGIARDIGITDDYGEVLEDLVKDNLIFTNAKITDPLQNAMTAQEAKRWFGVAPPDLTLEARVRGVRWLYTYLRTFYQDPARPWGTNNLVFVDVAMPNVLLNLQGDQLPVYRSITVQQGDEAKQVQVIDHLKTVENGSQNAQEFDQTVTDLVNFLAYVAEPAKSAQHALGWWVLAFLVLLIVVTYFLKREYWKDVH